MNKKVTVVFDGSVLRPDAPLNLIPNARYVVVIQELSEPAPEGDAWDVLEAMAGTVEAPLGWSAEHDYYLYGTPKRETPSTP